MRRSLRYAEPSRFASQVPSQILLNSSRARVCSSDTFEMTGNPNGYY